MKIITVLAGGLASLATAAPHKRSEPCSLIREKVEKWYKDNDIVANPPSNSPLERFLIPSAPPAPIPPSLAIACLQTVHLHKDAALEQLRFLRALVEWQSTIDYLKDPPKGYLSEGVDLVAGLEEIARYLEEDRYDTDFGWLWDVEALVARARDGHLVYKTLLWNLFTFVPGVQFVSVSKDGAELPEIYVYEDINHTIHGYTPSPVTHIDHLPAYEYLSRLAVLNGGAHDPDARYNSLFPSITRQASVLHVDPAIYPIAALPDETIVTLSNGTKLVYENVAYVRANFSGISTGEDLWKVYGDGSSTAPQPLSWDIYRAAAFNYTSDLALYPPNPVAVTPDGLVAGWLPDTPELKDTAILKVTSFSEVTHPDIATGNNTEEVSSLGEHFAEVVIETIIKAKKAGREKLVIDLQDNGGGLIINLLTLYFSLFPPAQDEPAEFPLIWQARVHDQLTLIGESAFNATEGKLPWAISQFIPAFSPPDNFTTFQDFFGPVANPAHWNTSFSTFPAQLNASFWQDPEAFGANWTSPPFKPENIVLLTDGLCASACALFVDALTHSPRHKGIKTVVVGGRPLKKPMQSVGMVRGRPLGTLQAFDELDLPEIEAIRSEDDPLLAKDGKTLLLPPTNSSIYRPPIRVVGRDELGTWGTSIAVNLMNVAPCPEDDDPEWVGVPMQVRYSAAQCKVFETWETVRDVERLWKNVRKVAWERGKCVEGSSTGEGGTIGDTILGYEEGVEDEKKLGELPGWIGE